MHQRTMRILIITFWLASMTWLASTKIAPILVRLERPDQKAIRPGEKNSPKNYLWEIDWKQKAIGEARMTVDSDISGKIAIRSQVDFTRLPLREISHELFGSFGLLMRLVPLDQLDTQMEMRVTSVSHFDVFGGLDRIASSVNLGDLGEIIQLEGRVDGHRLHMRVLPGSAFANSVTEGSTKALFSNSFDLPEDANVTNWLAPESRFRRLAIGQEWQYQVYRAFPPNQPYRTVQACVVSKEVLACQGEVVPVFVIELRDVTGTLTATRTDTSRMYVDDQGEVLKQELRLGSATLVFVRKEGPTHGVDDRGQ